MLTAAFRVLVDSLMNYIYARTTGRRARGCGAGGRQPPAAGDRGGSRGGAALQSRRPPPRLAFDHLGGAQGQGHWLAGQGARRSRYFMS